MHPATASQPLAAATNAAWRQWLVVFWAPVTLLTFLFSHSALQAASVLALRDSSVLPLVRGRIRERMLVSDIYPFDLAKGAYS